MFHSPTSSARPVSWEELLLLLVVGEGVEVVGEEVEEGEGEEKSRCSVSLCRYSSRWWR